MASLTLEALYFQYIFLLAFHYCIIYYICLIYWHHFFFLNYKYLNILGITHYSFLLMYIYSFNDSSRIMILKVNVIIYFEIYVSNSDFLLSDSFLPSSVFLFLCFLHGCLVSQTEQVYF